MGLLKGGAVALRPDKNDTELAVSCPCCSTSALRYRAVYNCRTHKWTLEGDPVEVPEPSDPADRNVWIKNPADGCKAYYDQAPANPDSPPAPPATAVPPNGWQRSDCCGECADGFEPISIDPTRLYCFQHTFAYPVTGDPPAVRAEQRNCMWGFVVDGATRVGCQSTLVQGRLYVTAALRITGDCDFSGQLCGPVEWIVDDCYEAPNPW